MMKGPRADEAGIVYLREEEYEFQTKDGGRIWSVYGSPVRMCLSIFNCFYETFRVLFIKWSPEFCDWAFNYPREEGESKSILYWLHVFNGRFSACFEISKDRYFVSISLPNPPQHPPELNLLD
jgi:hypothetical protein